MPESAFGHGFRRTRQQGETAECLMKLAGV
jgi:hypothetical protein